MFVPYIIDQTDCAIVVELNDNCMNNIADEIAKYDKKD